MSLSAMSRLPVTPSDVTAVGTLASLACNIYTTKVTSVPQAAALFGLKRDPKDASKWICTGHMSERALDYVVPDPAAADDDAAASVEVVEGTRPMVAQVEGTTKMLCAVLSPHRTAALALPTGSGKALTIGAVPKLIRASMHQVPARFLQENLKENALAYLMPVESAEERAALKKEGLDPSLVVERSPEWVMHTVYGSRMLHDACQVLAQVAFGGSSSSNKKAAAAASKPWHNDGFSSEASADAVTRLIVPNQLVTTTTGELVTRLAGLKILADDPKASEPIPQAAKKAIQEHLRASMGPSWEGSICVVSVHGTGGAAARQGKQYLERRNEGQIFTGLSASKLEALKKITQDSKEPASLQSDIAVLNTRLGVHVYSVMSYEAMRCAAREGRELVCLGLARTLPINSKTLEMVLKASPATKSRSARAQKVVENMSAGIRCMENRKQANKRRSLKDEEDQKSWSIETRLNRELKRLHSAIKALGIRGVSNVADLVVAVQALIRGASAAKKKAQQQQQQQQEEVESSSSSGDANSDVEMSMDVDDDAAKSPAKVPIGVFSYDACSNEEKDLLYKLRYGIKRSRSEDAKKKSQKKTGGAADDAEGEQPEDEEPHVDDEAAADDDDDDENDGGSYAWDQLSGAEAKAAALRHLRARLGFRGEMTLVLMAKLAREIRARDSVWVDQPNFSAAINEKVSDETDVASNVYKIMLALVFAKFLDAGNEVPFSMTSKRMRDNIKTVRASIFWLHKGMVIFDESDHLKNRQYTSNAATQLSFTAAANIYSSAVMVNDNIEGMLRQLAKGGFSVVHSPTTIAAAFAEVKGKRRNQIGPDLVQDEWAGAQALRAFARRKRGETEVNPLLANMGFELFRAVTQILHRRNRDEVVKQLMDIIKNYLEPVAGAEEHESEYMYRLAMQDIRRICVTADVNWAKSLFVSEGQYELFKLVLDALYEEHERIRSDVLKHGGRQNPKPYMAKVLHECMGSIWAMIKWLARAVGFKRLALETTAKWVQDVKIAVQESVTEAKQWVDSLPKDFDYSAGAQGELRSREEAELLLKLASGNNNNNGENEMLQDEPDFATKALAKNKGRASSAKNKKKKKTATTNKKNGKKASAIDEDDAMDVDEAEEVEMLLQTTDITCEDLIQRLLAAIKAGRDGDDQYVGSDKLAARIRAVLSKPIQTMSPKTLSAAQVMVQKYRKHRTDAKLKNKEPPRFLMVPWYHSSVGSCIEAAKIALDEMQAIDGSENGDDYQYVVMTGEVKDDQEKSREKVIRRATKDKRVRIFIATRQTVGEGMNLQDFNSLIIFNPDFRQENDAQIAGRIIRPNQIHVPMVTKLWVPGTIDEHIRNRQEQAAQFVNTLSSNEIIMVKDSDLEKAAQETAAKKSVSLKPVELRVRGSKRSFKDMGELLEADEDVEEEQDEEQEGKKKNKKNKKKSSAVKYRAGLKQTGSALSSDSLMKFLYTVYIADEKSVKKLPEKSVVPDNLRETILQFKPAFISTGKAGASMNINMSKNAPVYERTSEIGGSLKEDVLTAAPERVIVGEEANQFLSAYGKAIYTGGNMDGLKSKKEKKKTSKNTTADAATSTTVVVKKSSKKRARSAASSQEEEEDSISSIPAGAEEPSSAADEEASNPKRRKVAEATPEETEEQQEEIPSEPEQQAEEDESPFPVGDAEDMDVDQPEEDIPDADAFDASD